MKKLILSLFSLTTFIAGVIAQPAFTSGDMPNIGDNDTVQYINYHAITNNLDTETGNGYVWDFSSLPFTPTFFNVDSFRVKTHAVSTPHTTATIEQYRSGSSGFYVDLYSYSNDTMFTHRTGTTTQGTSFSPPVASIKFPIAFNQSSDITSPLGTAGERRTIVNYDGYGTLKMPGNKNYTNIIRVKSIVTDTNYVINTTTTYISYIWYKQGGNVPILRMLYAGVTNLYFVYGSKAANVATGIGDEKLFSNKTNIFPNPTIGEINIHSENEIEQIALINISGKLILSKEVKGKTHQLNISELTGGIYFLRIKTSNGVEIKKVVKQH